MTPTAWVLTAGWCNSAPTFYGPFDSDEQARGYVQHLGLDDDDACVSWAIEILEAAEPVTL